MVDLAVATADGSPDHSLTIRGLKVRPVDVPLEDPVVTASGTVSSAPLVLVDLLTREGITGRGYIFTYSPAALLPTARLVQNMAAMIEGESVAPHDLDRLLQQRFRLLGAEGLTGMAMAGIDMAAWDALAQARNMPLAEFLGGACKPTPSYYSAGMIDEPEAERLIEKSLGMGFRAFKVKVGYPSVEEDRRIIRFIRRLVGDEFELMIDFNQSLDAPEAESRTRALASENLTWIEEPLLHHDFAGHSAVRRKVKTPIQIGENWWGIPDMTKSLAAGASDLCMPDAMKIGGVTGWMKAAALAGAHGMPMSSHLFVEVSAHLLAVTPTAHWHEYLDLAKPVLQRPLEIRDGDAIPSDEPGTGVDWDEDSVGRYLVD
ncbi:MAG: mandelate racemase [Alphaproteobacteria bacterium]|nr:mandelate racemase [Alphaproteobacteria bacterium]